MEKQSVIISRKPIQNTWNFALKYAGRFMQWIKGHYYKIRVASSPQDKFIFKFHEFIPLVWEIKTWYMIIKTWYTYKHLRKANKSLAKKGNTSVWGIMSIFHERDLLVVVTRDTLLFLQNNLIFEVSWKCS